MPPKMKPAFSVPGKIAMPSAFAAIELGMAVSEVVITSLSTVIDSRTRLASAEFGPSWAFSENERSAGRRAPARMRVSS